MVISFSWLVHFTRLNIQQRLWDIKSSSDKLHGLQESVQLVQSSQSPGLSWYRLLAQTAAAISNLCETRPCLLPKMCVCSWPSYLILSLCEPQKASRVGPVRLHHFIKLCSLGGRSTVLSCLRFCDINTTLLATISRNEWLGTTSLASAARVL